MKRSPRDALALCASYPTTPDLRHVHAIFNRPEVAAAYLFGSLAYEGSHPLSDIDLAPWGRIARQRSGFTTRSMKHYSDSWARATATCFPSDVRRCICNST